MLKLYLTLEDEDGQKNENVVQGNKDTLPESLKEIVESMIRSLEESKKPL